MPCLTLQLDVKKRAELASELIASLDGPSDPDAVAVWSEEIERRVTALESGDAKLESWVDLRRRIERDILGRRGGVCETSRWPVKDRARYRERQYSILRMPPLVRNGSDVYLLLLNSEKDAERIAPQTTASYFVVHDWVGERRLGDGVESVIDVQHEGLLGHLTSISIPRSRFQ